MKVNEFINQFKNHPIIFMGAGMTQRYYENAYNWDQLLSKLCFDLFGEEETYLNIKYDEKKNYPVIASKIEEEYDKVLKRDRNGKFKHINDLFFDRTRRDAPQCSRMKLYLSEIISGLKIKGGIKEEIDALVKAKKNICSVVTTNYDMFVEDTLGFQSLVGNKIILSNPYGSVYKIHGSVDCPESIVLTKEDYDKFDLGNELIKAQLVSLFIHNPIIFMGYGMNDDDIKSILETIFKYVSPNTEESERIQKNFLLVDYEKGSINTQIEDYSITLQQNRSIRINKLRTDDFISVYKAIAGIKLPISVMDIRKVESVVRKICVANTSDSIQVRITDDIDSLENKDTILAIGSEKNIKIKYDYLSIAEIIQKYFEIIDNNESDVLSLIDKQGVHPSQYFPIYGFSILNPNIKSSKTLKSLQPKKLQDYYNRIKKSAKKKCTSVKMVLEDTGITKTYKDDCIMWNVWNDNINLSDLELFLKNKTKKADTRYRILLCLYDYKKYK